MPAPSPEEFGLGPDQVNAFIEKSEVLPTRTVIAGTFFGLVFASIVLLFAGYTLQNILIALFLFGIAGTLIGLYMAVYQQAEIQRILSIFSPTWKKYMRYRTAVEHYRKANQ